MVNFIYTPQFTPSLECRRDNLISTKRRAYLLPSAISTP